MNLLEVKISSKTYGNGEAAVKALKDVLFCSKGRLCKSSGNPVLVKSG